MSTQVILIVEFHEKAVLLCPDAKKNKLNKDVTGVNRLLFECFYLNSKTETVATVQLVIMKHKVASRNTSHLVICPF